MKAILPSAGVALALLSNPVLAQVPDPHAGHTMGPAPTRAAPAQTAPAPTDPHAGHGGPTTTVKPHGGQASPAPAGDPHAGHGPQVVASPSGATGADLPVRSATPPAVATDNLADRYFSAEAMSRARDILKSEHGGVRVSKVMANIAELQTGPGGGGYRWDVEGWYGGDINRLVVKTEGEGGRGGGLELAETQLLYSRAVGRYADLQVGLRHDVRPRPQTTYATVSVETLLPYWWETEAALFLSEDGDLRGRAEAWYDLRLTQRVVLQAQGEVGVSAQDVPKLEVGSGITHAEVGLRLRYEIRREFAPYIGVAYERSLGRTADFARAAGDRAEAITFVAGIRSWF